MNPFLPKGQRIPYQLPPTTQVPFYLSNEHVTIKSGGLLSPSDRFRKQYQFATPGPGQYGKLPMPSKRYQQIFFENHSKITIRSQSPDFIDISIPFRQLRSPVKTQRLYSSDRFNEDRRSKSMQVLKRPPSKFCE
uniref:Uncharacterized protein n=1 Tax=Spironucleus salmonicida TaxID=348837 RepID=V6LV84_9EUKA|eukprot:EST48552.1 Hypothetical protein SS50377_11163 [Spironucleus salmonicida]